MFMDPKFNRIFMFFFSEISYISNQQTLPLTSAKLLSTSRKAMTPVHFLTDMDDEQCRKMMASNTVRKQSSGDNYY